jgi:hypothetical protein
MFRVHCLAPQLALYVFVFIIAIIAIAFGADSSTTTAYVLATAVAIPADRPRHLTRRQIPPFLLEKLDLPLGYSTLCKECADGHGPTPAFEFGVYLLYTEAEVIRWALARCRPVPDKAADSPAAVADDITKAKRGRPPKPKPEIASTTSVVG